MDKPLAIDESCRFALRKNATHSSSSGFISFWSANAWTTKCLCTHTKFGHLVSWNTEEHYWHHLNVAIQSSCPMFQGSLFQMLRFASAKPHYPNLAHITYKEVADGCRPHATLCRDTSHGDTEICDVMPCEIVHYSEYKQAQLENHSFLYI